VVVVIVPSSALILTSWAEGRGRLLEVMTAPGFGSVIGNTFGLATAVTALAVAVGVAIALALRDPQLPGRRFWQVVVLLPVLIPDFVQAYSWLRAYARAGLSSELFGFAWTGVSGPIGVAVIVASSAVPLVYVITTVGLATRAEPITERAARASGATPFTVLRTITLPLLASAVAAAAVLVFVLTMGTFAVPQIIGAPAGFEVITTRIYADLAYASDPQSFVDATTLAVLLMLVTLVVVLPGDRLLGGRLQLERSVTRDTAWSVNRPTTRVLLTTGLGLYVLATSGLPLMALVSTAITRAIGVPATPSNWTTDNFAEVLTPRTGDALIRSLLLAAVAASLLIVLGATTAAFARTGAGRSVGVLVTLTLVLPGSALAIGLLLGYGRWLADTVAIILLAYLAKLWALAHRPILAAVDRLPPAGLRAARASGADLPTGLRTVALPLLWPALVAAWGLCFLTALHEVTMSSLLYGPGTETLAVMVLNSADLGRVGVTAALAVLVTVIVLVPAGAIWVLSWRRRA
jgi:iron(III) transport system permease protein